MLSRTLAECLIYHTEWTPDTSYPKSLVKLSSGWVFVLFSLNIVKPNKCSELVKHNNTLVNLKYVRPHILVYAHGNGANLTLCLESQ